MINPRIMKMMKEMVLSHPGSIASFRRVFVVGMMNTLVPKIRRTQGEDERDCPCLRLAREIREQTRVSRRLQQALALNAWAKNNQTGNDV